MEQLLNNNQNDFLWTLLADPAEDARLYVYNLQRLVNDYPQSGVLRALLAHASEDKNLRQASTCLNPSSVYKLINSPLSLVGVPDEKLYISQSLGDDEEIVAMSPLAGSGTYSDYNVVAGHAEQEAGSGERQSQEQPNQPVESIVAGMPRVETDVPPPLIVPAEGQAAVMPANDASGTAGIEGRPDETVMQTPGHEALIAPANETPLFLQEEQRVEATKVPVSTSGQVSEEKTSSDNLTGEGPEAAQQPDELPPALPVIESAAEEIKAPAIPDAPSPVPSVQLPEAVEIRDEPVETNAGTLSDTFAEPVAEVDADAAGDWNKPVDGLPDTHITEDVFDEIVGIDQINIKPLETAGQSPAGMAGIPAKDNKADFFTFEKMYGEHKNAEEEVRIPLAGVADTAPDAVGNPAYQDVSMYHDEKLPYSFLWWLDKTRKEHAGVYQPYIAATQPASAPKKIKTADELQQQYFENIFHITSVEDLEKSTAGIRPLPADDKRKDQMVIIERFIKEEPQIRPQSSDKLDNENKAKKSSEDRDELVSETLAAIYSEQMLYHKAIASYKKLMLKFPQKSRYFAEKLEQLEKKIN